MYLTVSFFAAVTLSSLLLNSLSGYAFAKYRFPGHKILFLALLGTLMIPIYTSLIPVFPLMCKLKWVDTYQGLIVPNMPFVFGIFLMRQFFTTLPGELMDAVRIDGAGEGRIFWQIMLPLAKPALSTLAVFTFLSSWNNFLWPLVITASEEMHTLPLAITFLSGGYGILSWPLLIAVSTVVTLVLFFYSLHYNGISSKESRLLDSTELEVFLHAKPVVLFGSYL